MSLERDQAFRVPDGVKRKPLDGVLRAVTGVSWGDARRLVETGKVQVRGAFVSDSRHPVSTGDEIAILLRAPRPATRERLSKAAIAFVDAHVVVVRKPPGVSTVPFDEGERGTLDQLVRALLSRESKGRGGGPQGTLGVVHRLDKETSGLLVFARTLAAKKHLSQQFRDHTVHRRYLAIVHGDARAQTIRTRLVADRGDGFRGSTRDPKLGQEAVTHVEIVQRLEGATLIACRLETGRTHQIRIHLAEAGHPIAGERVYMRRWGGAVIPAPRVMLHAAELGFVHPHTERERRFEEPLPADIRAVIAALGGTAPPLVTIPMSRGYLALVLHAHLPFVRHPEHERPLEERWLHEAIAECYLPILGALDRLERDGVPFAFTMSLTPPLAAMLSDALLRDRFEDHLARMR